MVRGFAAYTLCTSACCVGSRPTFTRSTASRPSYVVGQVPHGVGLASGGAVPHVGWLPTNTIATDDCMAAVVAALPVLSAAYRTVSAAAQLGRDPLAPGHLVGREAAVPVAQHGVGARPDDRDAVGQRRAAQRQRVRRVLQQDDGLARDVERPLLVFGVVHGVSVPAIFLYGTYDAGSRSPAGSARATPAATRRPYRPA